MTPDQLTAGQPAAGPPDVELALEEGPLRPRTFQYRLAESAERLATSISVAATSLTSQLWPKETAKSEVLVHHV